jgi:hypothetical protein
VEKRLLSGEGWERDAGGIRPVLLLLTIETLETPRRREAKSLPGTAALCDLPETIPVERGGKETVSKKNIQQKENKK